MSWYAAVILSLGIGTSGLMVGEGLTNIARAIIEIYSKERQ